MIIIDLSQTVISSCVVDLHNELKKSSPEQGNLLIKHMTFNTILGLKKKFGAQYGNIVLACDDKNYWRKEYFPFYKGQRKHSKEKSDINWEVVYKAMNEIISDLKEYFPYHVIQSDRAEADDVIACLVKHLQDNELKQDGLFTDEPQNILIVSRDGDFKQLQKYKNVQQWSIIDKKMLKELNPQKYLFEHITGGDAGDNIPSVLNDDSWAEARSNNESVRAKPLKQERLAEFVANGIDACKTETEKRNWIRNETLVSFDKIPDDIYNNIISEYTNYKVKGNVNTLMNYFSKNRMKVLFAELSNF